MSRGSISNLKRVGSLVVVTASLLATGCTYKSRRNLWHMQADYNSFQAPSVQIERKFKAAPQPSKVQQYRWMYNHWPDEISRKGPVQLVNSEVVVEATGSEVEVAVQEAPAPKRPNSDGVGPKLRHQTQPTEKTDSPSKPHESSPTARPAPSELPPFERKPSRDVASESPPVRVDRASIRQIPDIDVAPSSHPEPASLPEERRDIRRVNGDRESGAASFGPRSWSFGRGLDRPLTNAAPVSSEQQESEPFDLIQRPKRVARQTTSGDPTSANSGPVRVTNSTQSPAWWGSDGEWPSRSQTEMTPQPKPQTPIPAADDSDYSIEGVFEIR